MTKKLPRGVLNKNPGNIRISESDWRGKVPLDDNEDHEFEQFTSMVYGIRALMVLLTNYIIGGHNTVRKIISRYAPKSENDTEAYVKAVCQRTWFDPDDPLLPNEHIIKRLVKAMCYVENGGDYIKDEDANQAWLAIK